MASAIEWTDDTWNPVAGCSRCSPGCLNCYAIPQSARCAGFGHEKYDGIVAHIGGRLDFTGRVNFDAAALNIPYRKTASTIYFVNSMSDLFGEGVSDDQIKAVFDVMNRTPRHTYQILTKRPNRALRMASEFCWTPNIWMGTSIEMDKYVGRARLLAKIPAALRFISAEPLLSDLPSLDLSEIGWVIVGGESGVSSTVRPMDAQWARNIRDRCNTAGVPFFFKQWGSFGPDGIKRGKRWNGHLLDDAEYFEMPEVVQKAMTAKPAPAAPRVPITIAAGALAPASISPGRAGYRTAILSRLQAGPMEAIAMRAANGATDRREANLHAWALVDLQRERRITKRRDGRYGLLLRAAS